MNKLKESLADGKLRAVILHNYPREQTHIEQFNQNVSNSLHPSNTLHTTIVHNTAIGRKQTDIGHFFPWRPHWSHTHLPPSPSAHVNSITPVFRHPPRPDPPPMLIVLHPVFRLGGLTCCWSWIAPGGPPPHRPDPPPTLTVLHPMFRSGGLTCCWSWIARRRTVHPPPSPSAHVNSITPCV